MINPSEIERIKERVKSEGRYSAESVRISRAQFDLKELDRLADRSRALANDTLYLLRQCYFFHTTSNPEKKNLYRRNIVTKYYKIIKDSKYSNEKKERAIEILEIYFKDGLRALKGTAPTVMKFMESFKDIGYAPCAQQIVLAICNTFSGDLKSIQKYYKDLKKWNNTAENRRGSK